MIVSKFFKSGFVFAGLVLGQLAFGASLGLDLSKSKLNWEGKKVSGAHDGEVKIKSGSVEFDGKTPKAGNIVIDLTTITNSDLKDAAYNKKLVDHLKSDDFFNVSKFPEATVKINKIEPIKDKADEYKVTADLTVKGKTNPIEFPATIKPVGTAYQATAELKIDRTKWDIKYNSGKFFDIKKLGDKMINDEISFKLDMYTQATKATM
ncbi:MAG: YceI family protein [Oligoflexales bacterium]|nr:YceI family protein [Oligoflexales bacterium]